ncbi:MAG: hypothetical protein LQ342_002654 [Letrouitia transgressa]|nr:MAG: hypothetical protein LQ342_002654 [Letrouitia transgressa]
MVAPGPRLRNNQNEFSVNENPETLDRVLNKVLGKGGNQMLTEDVKWLAVTHKSFDHGRRGFNDRLAFFGKRIVELQASLRLLAGSTTTPEPTLEDEFGRTPFKHPALEGLRGVTPERQELILNRTRMAQLARRYGLAAVLRWKPKHV